jgi:hypothetical protein
MRHSQVNYYSNNDIMESRSEGKAKTSFNKDISKLEEKSFGIKRMEKNKKTKEASKQVEKGSYENVPIELFDEDDVIIDSISKFIDTQDELDDFWKDLFIGKVINTKDGLLLSKIWQIKYDLSFMIISSIYYEVSSLYSRKDYEKLKIPNKRNYILPQKLKDLFDRNRINSYDGDTLNPVQFDFKRGTSEINKKINKINDAYETSISYDEYGVRINEVIILLLDVSFEEKQIVALFRKVIKNLLEFEIITMEFQFLSKYPSKIFEIILNFLDQKDIKYVRFLFWNFDLSLLCHSSKRNIKSKWIFANWAFYLDENFYLKEGYHWVFKNAEFANCVVKQPTISKVQLNDPLINMLDIFNRCLLKSKGILRFTMLESLPKWKTWCSIHNFKDPIYPNYFNKFVYKVRNHVQEYLIQNDIIPLIKSNREDQDEYLFGEWSIDEYAYHQQGDRVLLPQFTMNYSAGSNDKIVVEVTTTSMNACELIQLLYSLSSTPSCLVNLHYFSMNIGNHWIPKDICPLEELYLNNRNFIIYDKCQEQNLETITARTMISIKLFLKQMAYLKFREDFNLYFENQDMYFLVWNVILRTTWENQEITDRVNQLSKHICRTFNVSMVETKLFRHKINLFTLEEIEKCVVNQMMSSFFLKSTKLVIWNWWISAKMLICWISQEIFSQMWFSKIEWWVFQKTHILDLWLG